MQDQFQQICELARQDGYLQSSLALLEWDQHTKLPGKAGAYRADQITFLSGQLHCRQTESRRGELLSEIIASDWLKGTDLATAATVSELKREYDKKAKLPQSLVEAIARACSEGQQIWVEARANNDFRRFAPALENIFRLKREQADAIGYQDQPYDALLDDYEPGARTADVAAVLSALKDELVPLIEKVSQSDATIDTSFLNRRFPIDQQEAFCKTASSRIGFDYDRGRLDVTHHPFCTETGPNDVRITTRYDENFFSSAFFGTLHEAGHGIYEQGLPSEFYGLAPGQYCSLSIHESQSRLWENLVGRSRSFWSFFYGDVQKHFQSLSDVSVEAFYRAINRVAASLIRVEADEATYNLHIIIRFELEQSLLNGDLRVADLPDAWNKKYKQYLQIEPGDDAEGVLQDVHWSAGLIGYFPTYSLGNMYASQFFESAELEMGNLSEHFAAGRFGPLKDWLQTQIHAKGRCYQGDALVKEVTGNTISHQPLMRHLWNKLSEIYEL